MATAEQLLDLARQEIGTAEEPAGSNRVKYNTAYYGREVSGDSYPWCCVFVWWLFYQTGCQELFYGGKKTASCGTLAAWAKKQGGFVSTGYLPGDLVFMCFSGQKIQHIGIVESVQADGSLVTIEGNTGSGSEANGGQVQRKTRPMQYVRGAFRPEYEEETVTQEQFNAMMNVWLEQRAEWEPTDFSAEAREWAEGTGLILGDSMGRKQYKSFCTREQMLVFLHRLRDLLRGEFGRTE